MKDQIALLRNVALVATGSYIEAGVGLLAGVLIARALGPTGYGHYAFGIWLCGALILASNNGLSTSAIKFVAEARGAGRDPAAAALVSLFLRLQFTTNALVVGGFAVAMLLWPVDDWGGHVGLMIGIAIVAVWSRAGFWMRASICKGFEHFLPENVAIALTAMLNLVLVVVLAWRHGSTEQFFAAYAGLGVVSNLLVRWLMRRMDIRGQAGPLPAELRRRLRRHVLQTGLMMLLFVGCNRAVEMTLLKATAGPETVGYFAIAGVLTKGAVELLAGGMTSVLLPAMSRRFGEGGGTSLGALLSESTRLYWFIGMAIAGLGLTVSDGLVRLLYGHRYEGAIPALMWHLVIAGLAVMNGAASAALTASDRQWDRIRVLSTALVVNLALGLLLIPRFGLPGAIVSFGVTQLTNTALCWSFAFRRTQVRLPVAPMARLLAAAAVATALGWAVAESVHARFAFLGGACVFLTTYLWVSVLLHAWREDDYELVASVLGRIPRVGPALSPCILSLRRYALPPTPWRTEAPQPRE